MKHSELLIIPDNLDGLQCHWPNSGKNIDRFEQVGVSSNLLFYFSAYQAESRTFRINLAITFLLTGFIIYSLIPIFWAAASLIMLLYPVQRIIGMSDLLIDHAAVSSTKDYWDVRSDFQ